MCLNKSILLVTFNWISFSHFISCDLSLLCDRHCHLPIHFHLLIFIQLTYFYFMPLQFFTLSFVLTWYTVFTVDVWESILHSFYEQLYSVPIVDWIFAFCDMCDNPKPWWFSVLHWLAMIFAFCDICDPKFGFVVTFWWWAALFVTFVTLSHPIEGRKSWLKLTNLSQPLSQKIPLSSASSQAFLLNI